MRSLTQRIMEATEGRDAQSGGAGGTVSYSALKRADQNWARIRNMKTGQEAGPAPETVHERSGSWKEVGTSGQEGLGVYDVAVCGGTLGVFLATALQLRGKKVAIVERGVLMGVRWALLNLLLAVCFLAIAKQGSGDFKRGFLMGVRSALS